MSCQAILYPPPALPSTIRRITLSYTRRRIENEDLVHWANVYLGKRRTSPGVVLWERVRGWRTRERANESLNIQRCAARQPRAHHIYTSVADATGKRFPHLFSNFQELVFLASDSGLSDPYAHICGSIPALHIRRKYIIFKNKTKEWYLRYKREQDTYLPWGREQFKLASLFHSQIIQ